MPNRIEVLEPFWDCWYIDECIGEGAFGKVYKLYREDHGRTYYSALKHIQIPQSEKELKQVYSEGLDEKSASEYFYGVVNDIYNEIELMAKLKGNSNIVSYEDHTIKEYTDSVGWDILIRMELLTSLTELIENSKITNSDVVKLGIDICQALEVCQKYNIIHRDIKPGNIFLSEIGNYKLGDFGIARKMEKTMSAFSIIKGTEPYMSPEVYKGESCDTSTDIYSLGIVMYRLLNGNRDPFMPPYPEPVTFKDREQALLKRMGGAPLPPPLNGDNALNAVIEKACAFRPDERYSSPRAMREELEVIHYGKPTTVISEISPAQKPAASSDSPDEAVLEEPKEPKPWFKQKPFIITAGIVAVVVLAVFIFIIVFVMDGGDNGASASVQPEQAGMGAAQGTGPLRISQVECVPRGTWAVLTWDAIDATTSYDVVVNQVHAGEEKQSEPVTVQEFTQPPAAGSAVSLTLEALEPSTSYEVQITPVRDALRGETENFIFTTKEDVLVEDLQAMDVTDTSVRLAWTFKGGSSLSWRVTATSPDLSGEPKSTSMITSESYFLFEGLQPDTSYTFGIEVLESNEAEPLAAIDVHTLPAADFDVFEIYSTQMTFYRAPDKPLPWTEDDLIDVLTTLTAKTTAVLLFECTWEPTETDKEFARKVIIRNPNGVQVTEEELTTVEGSWRGLYISFEIYPQDLPVAGDYVFEWYFDGGLVGTQEIAVLAS